MSEVNINNNTNNAKISLNSSGTLSIINNNKNIISFDKNGNIQTSKLLDIIRTQQTQINNLILYINNLKKFIKSFKEAVYIDDGNNKEINYNGLI